MQLPVCWQLLYLWTATAGWTRLLLQLWLLLLLLLKLLLQVTANGWCQLSLSLLLLQLPSLLLLLYCAAAGWSQLLLLWRSTAAAAAGCLQPLLLLHPLLLLPL